MLIIILLSLSILPSKIFCQLHEKFQFLSRNLDLVYQIQPLLIIEENGIFKLLAHDKLNEDGDCTLDSTQILRLYCSGFNNHIALRKVEQMDLCNPPIRLRWKKTQSFEPGLYIKEHVNKARCLSPFLGNLKSDKIKCANGKGIWVHAGFTIFDKQFLKQYSICFDQNTMSPIYTIHDLLGSKLLLKNLDLKPIPIKRCSRDYMNIRNVNAPYLSQDQEKRFQRIFGFDSGNKYLSMKDKEDRIFIPVLATPPDDFYFSSVQTGSYCFENSIPVFQSIYLGNWHTGEVLGRIVAQQLNKLLTVITGSFGILELPDDNGERKSVYLDEIVIGADRKKHRPIPKYLYKIFYDNVTKSGIAFVTLNNPYLKFDKTNLTNFPCEDITKTFMEINYFNPKPHAGNTICCSPKQLMELLDELKDLNFGDGILNLDLYVPEFPMDLLVPQKVNKNRQKI